MPEPESLPAVEIRGVSKKYGFVTALRDVSLEIGAGEFVAFSGHNGAGKTTLLRLMATHISPTAGTVRIFGRELSTSGPAIRARIGLLTHESYLYPDLSVRENFRFYSRIFSAGDGRSSELAGFFGLGRWLDSAAGTLSFGLRKRADLVRALLHDPELILLDEPFSGLDSRSCEQLARHFRAEKDAGKTVVVSSHSREWTGPLCDRELVFDRGRIVREIHAREG